MVSRSLRLPRSASIKARSYIVYRGYRELEVEGARVLPIETFLRRLHAGDIIV
jgi:hypothetical protein